MAIGILVDTMKPFGPMEEALVKNNFKLMLADLGFIGSVGVLTEILTTANILAEVLIEEQRRIHD